MTGDEFRDIRKGMKMSQERLAAEIGMTNRFVCMMERGQAPIDKRTALALLWVRHEFSITREKA